MIGIARQITRKELQERAFQRTLEEQAFESLQKIRDENKYEMDIYEKIYVKPISKEEREQNLINLYKKMTDYGMLDHNKFITIVITFTSGRNVCYTTTKVRETFSVTYDFCSNLFNSHNGYTTYNYGFFCYGEKDGDIIDTVVGDCCIHNYETSISPITQYSNIKNVKENYVFCGKIYDSFYTFHEL